MSLAAWHEHKYRLSTYHLNILDRSFVYLLFNTLIVPGLAVPTGYSLYNLVSKRLTRSSYLFSNFYNLNRADLFLIMFLQQIGFSVFFGLIPIVHLWHCYFSPAILSARVRINSVTHNVFKQLNCGFEFGYNYVLSVTVLCIVFVYG